MARMIRRPKYANVPSGNFLKWAQPNAMIRYHELKSDGDLLATLRWPHMYGSLAVGDCSSGRFTFKRAGFLKPSVTVRTEGAETDLAVVKLRFGLSGTVEFQNGAKFSLKRKSPLGQKWEIADEKGTLIISVTRRGGKPKAEVTVLTDPVWTKVSQILTMMTWYTIILGYEEREGDVGFFLQPGSHAP